MKDRDDWHAAHQCLHVHTGSSNAPHTTNACVLCPCLIQAWEGFVVCLILWFVYTTIVQLSVAKQVELDDEQNEKRKAMKDKKTE